MSRPSRPDAQDVDLFLAQVRQNRKVQPAQHPALGRGVESRILFQCQQDQRCHAAIMEALSLHDIHSSAVEVWPLAASMGIDRLEIIQPIPISISQLASTLDALPAITFAECDRAFQPKDRQPHLGRLQNLKISQAQIRQHLKASITTKPSARGLLAQPAHSGSSVISQIYSLAALSHDQNASDSVPAAPSGGQSQWDADRRSKLQGSSPAESTKAAATPASHAAQAAATVVNDPIWPAEWDRRIIGLTDRDATEDADALPGAWATVSEAPQVIVCITDSGIDYRHPDLAANMWTNPGEIANNGEDDDGNGIIDDVHGYNAVDNNGEIMDTDSHGTHTAGIVGAVANNGIGTTGIAQKVRHLHSSSKIQLTSNHLPLTLHRCRAEAIAATIIPCGENFLKTLQQNGDVLGGDSHKEP